MDFDHREGEVKASSTSVIGRLRVRSLLEELSKCDVVCANCHRERTYQRKQRTDALAKDDGGRMLL